MVKVSIIIPAYNVERYIGEALESAMAQSLAEIEILAVDDGSTDETGAILDAYSKKDGRIRVIHKKNTGYGHTMNVGIEQASGKYIAVLEADDRMLPDMLKNLYTVAETLKTELTRGDFIRFYEENGAMVKHYCHACPPSLCYQICDPQQLKPAVFSCSMMTWCGIVRRDFIEKWHIRHNETPGASYQDNGFWFQMICRANRVVYIDEPGYLYRTDNPASSVRRSDNIYGINEEYAFIYSYLFTRPELHKFLPVYWWKKYENALFTICRIPKEYRRLYAQHTRKEFMAAENKGELDKRFFFKKYWDEVQILLSSADEYLGYKGLL